jgi:uncharacterized protein YeaO (DUF488 family)
MAREAAYRAPVGKSNSASGRKQLGLAGESENEAMRRRAARPNTSPVSGSAPRLGVKRVYAAFDAQDGTRILVDRLWPRGIAKDKAKIDLWLKDIAPSEGLRRRVHTKQATWHEFEVDYARELAQEPGASAAQELLARIAREPVTLLYAAREETHNNAIALKNWLLGKLAVGRGAGAAAKKPPRAYAKKPAPR